MFLKEVRKKILVIDDEESIRSALSLLLKNNFDVETASSGQEAVDKIDDISPDMIFLDVFMPKLDGIDTLKKLKSKNIDTPIVMLSGISTVQTAVEAMKLGAIDYLSKPFDIEDLTNLIVETLFIENISCKEKKDLIEEISDRKIVGSSSLMKDVYEKIDLLAPHSTSVLVTGESGTGKELVARRIHALSKRSDLNFIAINCAAIPENLIESELFGHEKGSFTNAHERRIGLIEQADGGTVFLDEIGELSLAVQVKLLRFLQEKEFYRVGGKDLVKVDVRILSATNKDLLEQITKNEFREDLYYRINVVDIELPPLRERNGDLQELITYFRERFSAKYNSKNLTFSDEAISILDDYSWPGNIRELENTIESLYALVPEGEVNIKDLPPKVKSGTFKEELEIITEDNFNFQDAGQKFEIEMIIKALKKTKYVQTKAAKLLGITRRVLKYKMDKFGIEANPR